MAASAAGAATQHADTMPPLDIPSLADLLTMDPLGYDCIPEEVIDVAFHATGKGVRLPRTCLPEPCEAALTEVELASLIGRPPFMEEWDDYFSRYADFCRKEVVAFDEAPVAEGDHPATFWAPLIASYPANAPIRSRLPSGFRSAGGFSIPSFGSFSSTRPFDPGPGPKTPFDDPERPVTPIPPKNPGPDAKDPPPEPLTPVPLPAGWTLVLTGVACLLFRRRRTAAR